MITWKKENCFSWVSKQNREPIIGLNSLLRSRFYSYKLLQADRDAIRKKKSDFTDIQNNQPSAGDCKSAVN